MATLKELEAELATAKSQVVKDQLSAEIQKVKLQTQATEGDDVAKMLLAVKEALEATKRGGGGGGINKTEVEALLKEALKKSKIRLEDLSDELRAHLTSAMKVSLAITTDKFARAGGTIDKELFSTTLFQKVLSDAVSLNNIYLFGGAGTGKTYLAEQLADFLGYEFILLPCNQFTSPLEILGGQTIEGYQLGKLERAWGNLDKDGNPSTFSGALLCLDELPKIDPNTAGLLNDALSRVKIYKGGLPPVIENGRGLKISKGNLVIIATGNLKLNEMSTDYEANFKQDLSLQDRFAGSTYEVTVDYQMEYTTVMKGFAFLWIALTRLREKIIKERWTGQAFVSLRIMGNLKATYITYREAMAKNLQVSQPVIDALQSPKTLQQGIDSFLNLFKPDQMAQLKTAMGYDNFLVTLKQKDTMPLNALNVPTEEDIAMKMIEENKIDTLNKTA